ncbi:MAG TPA: RagB/SusD family nutrient uptake outer membrane protein, partial [Sphingobacterium sp.]|nr:RagB/SusD family nutrient uptake outer membrane protein [Sphingobacterium sp.]
SHALANYSFQGLDADEQYLIKAECLAHLGSITDAMNTLNHLLRHRHRDYIDKTATSQAEALEIIRQERRKELLFRGLRWSDLKRYNRDGANITLTRTFGDKTYTLPPNSSRWLFPIPSNEIKTSGIEQNIRLED